MTVQALDIDGIRDFAARFRAALDRLDPASLSVGFHQFPLGACGDTCLLLGTALIERELGEFQYICGHNLHGGNFESHAWLAAHAVIVDITADQFNEGMPPVFVGEEAGWYGKWSNRTNLGTGDYHLWNKGSAGELGRSYKLIMDRL
ncbi:MULTISPECIES: hypothetical protein [unclassified Bradyrhizobium]